MVESLHAHVAVVAVSGSRGPKDVARIAEFYFLGVSFHCACVEYRLVVTYGPVKVPVAYRNLTIGWVLKVAKDFRYYSRIY